ncbi:HNH endonuclease family protein [Nocardioides sp. SYSU DS0651]|uniref:HNH endonuclease family protein n=1 Tax=Nocardioides sp. SYSU DS0651 TaxID=3415955 RepID=UPI003F4C717D
MHRRLLHLPATLVASLLAVLGLLGLSGAVTACTIPGPESSEQSGPSETTGSSGPTEATQQVGRGASADTARSRLAALALTERVRRDDYRRDAFGTAWRDTDGNGCNQRDDVLLRDAVPGSAVVVRQGACDHDVLAGRWVDPYTGRRIVLDDLKDPSQAQAVQIDHVVPLAEAWASGAAGWSAARRERFANDLDGLLAVDGPTNAGKGADDPAAWRPRKAFQCEYAVRWIDTKSRWSLAADHSEVRALREMLDRCG